MENKHKLLTCDMPQRNQNTKYNLIKLNRRKQNTNYCLALYFTKSKHFLKPVSFLRRASHLVSLSSKSSLMTYPQGDCFCTHQESDVPYGYIDGKF